MTFKRIARNPRTIIPFPAVYPHDLNSLCNLLAEKYNCSPDYIMCSILVAVSVAIGGLTKVEVFETWQQNCSLFMAIVGQPGTKKTPALSFALKPLREISKRLSKGEQIVSTNATIESLASLLEKNPHGLLLWKDELSGWWASFNQYKKGGEDRQFYLTIWAGDDIVVNRKTQPTMEIENPFISVIGSLQVELLIDLTKMKNDGFADRLMFCFPNPVRFARSNVNVSKDHVDYYVNLLETIYKWNRLEITDEKCLRIEPEAQSIWEQWTDDLNDYKNNGNPPSNHLGILAKLESYVIRLSLILEYLHAAAEKNDTNSIRVKSMLGAIELADYFYTHAVRAHTEFSSSNLEKTIEAVTRWIATKEVKNTTPRELARINPGGITNADDARTILEIMESRKLGTIRSEGQKPLVFYLDYKYYKLN